MSKTLIPVNETNLDTPYYGTYEGPSEVANIKFSFVSKRPFPTAGVELIDATIHIEGADKPRQLFFSGDDLVITPETHRLQAMESELHAALKDTLPVTHEPLSLSIEAVAISTNLKFGHLIYASIDWDMDDKPWVFWDSGVGVDGMVVMPNTTPINEVKDAFVKFAKKAGALFDS